MLNKTQNELRINRVRRTRVIVSFMEGHNSCTSTAPLQAPKLSVSSAWDFKMSRRKVTKRGDPRDCSHGGGKPQEILSTWFAFFIYLELCCLKKAELLPSRTKEQGGGVLKPQS